MARVLAMLLMIGTACGHPPRNKPSWPDAPVALRDDIDREAAIDQMWVTPAGPERDRLRGSIAEAAAKRLTDAVVEDRPFVAAQLLDQLTGLWMTDPKNLATGLREHAPLIRELRKMFAKSGALEAAAQTLILLSEIEPANRTQVLAELDEVLQFADDLAIAENGNDAVRSQPLTLLQGTALQLPLPWLVDKYVKLLVDRQIAVSSLLEAYQKAPVATCTPGDPGCPSASGVTIELVRAHHDILATSHRIANVLARAGRASEIHRHLVNLKGIGTEREVSARAEVLAEHPTADAYGELASTLRADEHAPDPGAALALCQAGLAIDPRSSSLMAAAAGDARALERIDQSIVYYEAALATDRELDTQLALRLGKLYGERIARLAASGRPAAASSAWTAAIKYTARAAKQHPSVVWQQAAAIAESALGKGLASQGMIDAGRRALTASLERAPSTDAYESLTTIDVQTARYKDAQKWAAAGIALLGDTTAGDRYRRAKLERLGADALRQAGKQREAAARYLDSLRTWASLGETKELPRAIAAERLLESGRSMWWLGDRSRSIDLISKAVDFEPSAGTTTSGAVAFLIEAERYREALDVYYRGLGDPDGSELFKVYTSLWILAEGRRLGEAPDRLAVEYLSARRGDLWYELLGRAAVGKVTFEALRTAATTGPRKAELAFYGAVLGLDPAAATPDGKKKLLEEVIRARTVLDAEFDLARKYLSTP